MNEELPFCECGECGLRVTKRGNRFIHGHHIKGKNNPMYGKKHSPESIALISKSKKQRYKDNPDSGKENRERLIQWYVDNPEARNAARLKSIEQFSTQEAREKMSEIIRNSDAHKIASEKKLGGNDIVDHHIAYDFLQPKSLIVKVTRKFHGLIHHPPGIKFSIRGYSLID